MGARIVPGAVAGGVLLAYLLSYLLGTEGIHWIVGAGSLLGGFVLVSIAISASMVVPRGRAITVLLLLISVGGSVGWTWVNFQARLDQRLPPAQHGLQVEFSGTVSSLPRHDGNYSSFRFKPEAWPGMPVSASEMLVYWYESSGSRKSGPRKPGSNKPGSEYLDHEDRGSVRVGERWRFTLRLRTPRGLVNFQGSDRELWLFTENIGALGVVTAGQRLGRNEHWWFDLQRMRASVRRHFRNQLGESPALGILLALAIAETGDLSASHRNNLAITGTGHLTAISGLHIGLAATAGFWLTRLILLLLPWWAVRQKTLALAWMGALLLATGYAALAGFGVSTQRALIMLAVLVAARLLRRSTGALTPFMWALALVLVVDPLAPLRAGFWFSFGAVAVLLVRFAPLAANPTRWLSLLQAQVAVSLVTFPLAIFWFQSLSPAGIVANLLAIPWVSVVVVPLTFLSMASFVVVGPLTGLICELARLSASALLAFVDLMAGLTRQVQSLAPPVAIAGVAVVLGCLFVAMVPGPARLRVLALVAAGGLLIPVAGVDEQGALRVEFLDVGQGLAVIVDAEHESLLYDTGPGAPGQWDRVRSVIAPALAARRRPPVRIFVSHADLDHAGGLASLKHRFPAAAISANLKPDDALYGSGVEACVAGMAWRWRDLVVDVLHPSAGLPYLGNNSSCVLRVHSGRATVLLAGDVSTAIEQRLVAEGLQPFVLLQVPHHGSRSSSGAELLDSAQPRIAVATTGFGNRFGMPHQDIVERYRSRGVSLWTTADCGAIRVELDSAGAWHAASARRERNPIWRWPAATHCP